MSEEKTENQGLTPAEKDDAEIRENSRDDNADGEFGALFDEEVTEAALMGEEEETPAEEKPDEKSDKEAAASESEGEEKPGEKTEESEEKTEAKSEEVDYTKPPPKGYVPLPAVQEAREINKNLKTQIDTLQKTVELLQTQTAEKVTPEDDEFKDFEVLSQQKFDELVEDDVEEALKYQSKLARYNDHQRNVQHNQQIEVARKQKVDGAINQSIEKIVQSVPGIYEEGNNIASDLFEFAVSSGFDKDYLTLLTTPATRISPVDSQGNVSKESFPLADGAASMITMLYKLHQSVRERNPEELRSKIEAEVKEKLRKEITEELLEKFKNETTGQSFRSIADVPGGSDDEPAHKKFYSEADFSKMSEKEQQRILGGV
jgi:hypothetical protein